MKSKAIQVIPKAESYAKVETCAEKLGTSKAGFCVAALEYALPLIESGEMVLTNGKLVPVKQTAQAA